ncbi:MAG TPA: nucleotidyltransferase domain-containing protein [Pyrinomonadaceae bacterium]|nr:nucleotidyltransferase domain-containing protein [Pyrinomonadaceae bacterium]
MIPEEEIRELSERIAREFRPQSIILFGSYAYGTPTEDSDVDLLVILTFDGKPIYKALEILRKVRPRFPLDLLVRTPEQVKERVGNNDWFLREVLTEGRRLYESANP